MNLLLHFLPLVNVRFLDFTVVKKKNIFRHCHIDALARAQITLVCYVPTQWKRNRCSENEDETLNNVPHEKNINSFEWTIENTLNYSRWYSHSYLQYFFVLCVCVAAHIYNACGVLLVSPCVRAQRPPLS